MKVGQFAAGFAGLLLISSCGNSGASPIVPDPSALLNTSVHESAVDSPLEFGFTVPRGASQIGPLLRFRSRALLEEFQPDLAQAQLIDDTELAETSLEKALARSEPVSESSTKPYLEPLADSFALLENPPTPDVMYAFLRVDGDATTVFQNMLTQIREILPRTEVHPNLWSDYCTVENTVIQHCSVSTKGMASNGHELNVQLKVFPGDVSNKVAPAGAKLRPVMTLRVAYAGEPRAEQVDSGSFERTELPPGPSPEPQTLSWPLMKSDAPATDPLLDGEFIAPKDTTILLSGSFPNFVVLLSNQAKSLEYIAKEWVSRYSDAGEVERDVIENLNEFSTIYLAKSSKPGLVARAALVQSARGNYLVMSYLPGLPE